jgi:hypothetical protein
MALRINKAFVAGMVLCIGLNAQQADVRHRHLFGGTKATLQVSADGISLDEKGKNADHSQKWTWKDVQETELGSDQLRIQSYEESKTNSARGREYLFDHLPKEFVNQIRPVLRRNLPGRFIDAGPLKDSWFENR